eukprot:266729_1
MAGKSKTEYSALLVDNNAPQDAIQSEEEAKTSNNCCTTLHPVKSWKYSMFITIGFISLGSSVLYIFFDLGGYILALVTLIGMSLFAIYDFHDIFLLKQQIEDYRALSNEFDGELKKNEDSNMMLDRVSSNFEEVTNKFANDNTKLQKHIELIEEFIDDIKENKEEKHQNKTDAIQRAKQWLRYWEYTFLENVRNVMDAAFDNITLRGSKMTHKQYQQFLEYLPDVFQQRIQKVYASWDHIEKDNAQFITIHEFNKLMNNVCISRYKEYKESKKQITS